MSCKNCGHRLEMTGDNSQLLIAEDRVAAFNSMSNQRAILAT